MDADDVVKYCSGCFVVYFEDGYGLRVSFDENGDSKGRYNIMNFRRNRATRRYEYVTVGRWADRLSMDVFDHGINRITWAGGRLSHTPRRHNSFAPGQNGDQEQRSANEQSHKSRNHTV